MGLLCIDVQFILLRDIIKKNKFCVVYIKRQGKPKSLRRDIRLSSIEALAEAIYSERAKRAERLEIIRKRVKIKIEETLNDRSLTLTVSKRPEI